MYAIEESMKVLQKKKKEEEEEEMMGQKKISEVEVIIRKL